MKLDKRDMSNLRLFMKLDHYTTLCQTDGISKETIKLITPEYEEIFEEFVMKLRQGKKVVFWGDLKLMLYNEDQLRALHNILIIELNKSSYYPFDREKLKELTHKLNRVKKLLGLEHG